MLTKIRQFIWPTKEEIKGFNCLKWYQGFNFWYSVAATICLLVIGSCSMIYIGKTYSHKIPDIEGVLRDEVSVLGVYYMFFIYLIYRHYAFAYVLCGLWYYVFCYSIASPNQYFVPEKVWADIAVYVLGFFAARIAWYYRWFYPASNDELKKDCIIGLLMTEACFYLPFMLYDPYKNW